MEQCGECGGSGHAMYVDGHVDACRSCGGDGFVLMRDDRGRFCVDPSKPIGVLYHGGHAGLDIGDVLTSPAARGVKSAADYLPDELRAEAEHVRRDRVYVTTDLAAARVFAACVAGDVYLVNPLLALEPDPDYLAEPCESWQTPAAVIVEVVECGVTITPELLAAFLGGAS